MLQNDAQGAAETLGFNNDGVTKTVSLNYAFAAVAHADARNTLEVIVSFKEQPLFLRLVYIGGLGVKAWENIPTTYGPEVLAKGGVLQPNALRLINGRFKKSIVAHNGSSFAQSYRRTTLLTAHPRPRFIAEYHS